MKILEKLLAIGVLVGLAMKFNFIPGGDMIVLSTMFLLACIYFYFGFLFFNQIRLRNILKKVAYQDVSTFRIILATITGLGLTAMIVGVLYKLLSWPGAGIMLLIGLMMTVVVSVISSILFIKSRDENSKFILWRVAIIGGIGIVLLFTPESSIVKFQYRNHPGFLKAYSEYIANPQNDELSEKMELERERIFLSEEEFKENEESIKNKTN